MSSEGGKRGLNSPGLKVAVALLVLLCFALGGLLELLTEALLPGFGDTWVHTMLVGAIVGVVGGVATSWLLRKYGSQRVEG